MKNKNFFIVIFIILFWFLILFFILKNNIKTVSNDINIIENKNNLENKNNFKNDNFISEKDKLINFETSKINPNNYKTLEEFLWYLYTWSWIKLDVNLLKEDFYINLDNNNSIINSNSGLITNSWSNYSNYTYIKFNKELISDIDINNDKNYKNQAIQDIFNSYKKNKIYWESNNTRSWVRFLKKYELPVESQLHNNILSPFNWKTFLQLKSELELKNNKTNSDKKQLSYIYDFMWDYLKSYNIKKSLWLTEINYIASWVIKDSEWKTLSWVLISLLNLPNISTLSDKNWKYNLSFKTYPLTRLRFRAYLWWDYSDWYNWAYVLYEWENQWNNNLDFYLQKINKSEIVRQSDLEWWKTKVVKSNIWNSFEFKKWSLLDKNWKIYNWDFIAKIFEFNESTNSMDSFLNNDNFDSVYWYVWNLMKTAWMTYLLLSDLDWNELYISKKNPIKTIQKSNLDLMKSDYYWLWYKLTDEEIDLILLESKKSWYLIDREFLLKMNIKSYSPWWVFNLERWIRENSWIKLLNKSWLKEGLYYNVN